MAKKSVKKFERTNKEALDAVILALFENTSWNKDKIAERVAKLFNVSDKTVANALDRVEDDY